MCFSYHRLSPYLFWRFHSALICFGYVKYLFFYHFDLVLLIWPTLTSLMSDTLLEYKYELYLSKNSIWYQTRHDLVLFPIWPSFADMTYFDLDLWPMFILATTLNYHHTKFHDFFRLWTIFSVPNLTVHKGCKKV